MNKTISINIAGFIFHIEEEAYNKLRNYLETIRGYFNEFEGRDEIVGDIEARIAEMFNEKVSDSKQVVVMKDVDEVIAVMGQPEAFIDEDMASDSGSKSYSQSTEHGGKRLYRDPDNEVIGGVCGGVGAYFGIDPIWFRLAFLAALLFFGTGVLLYIILWIVIPEAKTTAQKLEMRGENVNVENIERTIREEMDHLKKKFEDISGDAKAWRNKDHSHKTRNTFQKILDFFIELLKAFFRVFGKVLGALLLALGIFLMVMFIGALLGLPTAISFENERIASFFLTQDFLEFFGSTSQISFGLIALILVIGIPIVQMIYGGIKILFNIKYKNKMIGASAGVLWLIGIVIMLIIGLQIGKDFSVRGSNRETVELQPTESEVVYLELTKNENQYGSFDFSTDDDTEFSISEDGNLLYKSPKFDILKSDDENFSLELIRSSAGATRKQAYKRAQNITYEFTQKDSVIQFDKYYNITKADKYRDQLIRLVLRVPEGKTVYLAQDMRHIIYDIDNVTNTWDGDMIGHQWKMTNRGLECQDCEWMEDDEWEDDVEEEETISEFEQDMLELEEDMKELERDLNETLSYNSEQFHYSDTSSDLEQYRKSRERFEFEMKRKLNEIYFEIRMKQNLSNG